MLLVCVCVEICSIQSTSCVRQTTYQYFTSNIVRTPRLGSVGHSQTSFLWFSFRYAQKWNRPGGLVRNEQREFCLSSRNGEDENQQQLNRMKIICCSHFGMWTWCALHIITSGDGFSSVTLPSDVICLTEHTQRAQCGKGFESHSECVCVYDANDFYRLSSILIVGLTTDMQL